MLYIDSRYIHLSFECTKKLYKLNTLNRTYKDKSVVVNILCPADNRDTVLVTAWAGNVGDKETLIFKQTVPYLKNQRYDISYTFSDNAEVVDFSNVVLKTTIWETDNYKCVKHYSPKYAKERYKYLRKNKLISKTFWDGYIDYYDILCEACHVDKSAYKALSTPMDGRVILLNENAVKYHPKKYVFTFQGKFYLKIPEKLWWYPTFWNKEEFKKVAASYEPKGEYKRWEKLSEYESKLGRYSRKDFPDFEKAWEMCGKYWVDCDGHYKNFNGHTPTIGLWERVVSPNYIEWLYDYDFKRLWDIEIPQEDIDEHKNIYGGAYRSIMRKDDYAIFSKENYKKSNNKSDLEKVVTKGWHNTPYPHSINCPVCEEMHEICASSTCWMPPWYKVRTKIGYWQSRMKLGIENMKYHIQKANIARKKVNIKMEEKQNV